ncbi:MAG: hypothetical protein IPL11_03795 [Candidatus Accumulibacter sp.]|nr:hypothetical protein [Accumulibacter sp.]
MATLGDPWATVCQQWPWNVVPLSKTARRKIFGMSLQQIHALIKSRDYDAALRELERGEGSIVALIDKQLLAYCQLKARVPLPGESAPAAARTPEAWSYISHGGRPGLDLQSMRIACGLNPGLRRGD